MTYQLIILRIRNYTAGRSVRDFFPKFKTVILSIHTLKSCICRCCALGEDMWLHSRLSGTPLTSHLDRKDRLRKKKLLVDFFTDGLHALSFIIRIDSIKISKVIILWNKKANREWVIIDPRKMLTIHKKGVYWAVTYMIHDRGGTGGYGNSVIPGILGFFWKYIRDFRNGELSRKYMGVRD